MKKLLPLLFLLFLTPAFATTYYVATDGSGDYTTIAAVNAATFVAGDSVLFRRGDTWREQLIPDSGSSAGHITYGAYGVGAKPLLLGSKQENQLADWSDEGSNIWSNNDASFTVDVGNIIFDNEASCGVKCALETDLDTQDEFWYDSTNALIKVYSIGNPASVHSNIECALNNHIIYNTDKDYVIYENLDLRYGSAHGFVAWNTNNIIIRNCNFSYLGGSYQTGTTRYGNAIEFWISANTCIVERNRIDNIYDGGITSQGDTANTVVSNLYFRNNIITNCEMSFEFWYSGGATATVNNVYVEHNTCLNAGSGWGHNQRSDPLGHHVNIYNNSATTTNFYIRNNIFYESADTGANVRWLYPADVSDFIFDYNCFYESSGTVAMINNGGSNYTMAQFANYQTATSQDSNSIATDPKVVNTYLLSPDSPCINAGTDVGIDFDYRNYPRDNTPSIGAIEYQQGVEYQGVKYFN